MSNGRVQDLQKSLCVLLELTYVELNSRPKIPKFPVEIIREEYGEDSVHHQHDNPDFSDRRQCQNMRLDNY